MVKTVENNDFFLEEYYILDTKERELYGPFQTHDEIKEKIDKYKITLEKWHMT